ncbi:MAG: hypothetical protein H0X29_05170 [Parachlamydiaceae bacterium]|nr:hypothetical protein [Parachlamydiaceae bacterium]
MTLINFTAAGIVIALLLAAVFFLLISSNEFPIEDNTVRKLNIPKGAFAKPPQYYDAIKEPVFSLKFAPLSVQLPDLRRQLSYFGRNGRPDAKDDRPVLYFAFGSNKVPSAVLPGQQYYLLYDKPQKQYVFSPDNVETPLWMEVTLYGNQAAIKIRMKGDKDQIISEPAANADFALAEKEFARSGGSAWELGKWRVDGTLLARQKAKWYGIDRFLEKHGGEEYKNFENKQRIDFGEPDEIYSVYVGPEDCMVWKDKHWQAFTPGKDTLGYPLLCVKKVDDRIMNLELWDVEGKGKIILNLLKTMEAWLPQNLMQSFKFLGSRTRSQFVFEINKERMLLRPQDWLVLTDKGWQKLVTPQEIDNYVDRKIVGPLFVFDGIGKKDDRPVIIGTLFNSARTEMSPVELPLQQQGNGPQNGSDRDQKLKGTNLNPLRRAQGENGNGREPPTPNGS